MRAAGYLTEKSQAKLFSSYLYSLGIESEVEEGEPGRWTIWVVEDDDLPRAREELVAFQQNPNDPKYAEGARRGEEAWKQQTAEEKKAKPAKTIDVRTEVWGKGSADQFRYGFLTTGLAIISVGVYVLMMTDYREMVLNLMFISQPASPPILPEVLKGQIWRLVTPIFLHFTLIHILFNMMWLWDLGNLVEKRHGLKLYAPMILLFAIVPNIGEYFYSGPAFGGMSGVVYGLLGFVWFRSKFDPSVGYELHQFIVWMMLGWLVLGFTGFIGPIANIAHLGGLVMGVLMGFVTAKWK